MNCLQVWAGHHCAGEHSGHDIARGKVTGCRVRPTLAIDLSKYGLTCSSGTDVRCQYDQVKEATTPYLRRAQVREEALAAAYSPDARHPGLHHLLLPRQPYLAPESELCLHLSTSHSIYQPSQLAGFTAKNRHHFNSFITSFPLTSRKFVQVTLEFVQVH